MAVESGECASEEALLKSLERPGRTAPVLVALDSGGKQMSSEELAEFSGSTWSAERRSWCWPSVPPMVGARRRAARAQTTLSLGKMTLPHELARVVLAEQIYRAFTILNHHPYHGGH